MKNLKCFWILLRISIYLFFGKEEILLLKIPFFNITARLIYSMSLSSSIREMRPNRKYTSLIVERFPSHLLVWAFWQVLWVHTMYCIPVPFLISFQRLFKVFDASEWSLFFNQIFSNFTLSSRIYWRELGLGSPFFITLLKRLHINERNCPKPLHNTSVSEVTRIIFLMLH